MAITTTATQIDSVNFFHNYEWTPIRFSFEEKEVKKITFTTPYKTKVI